MSRQRLPGGKGWRVDPPLPLVGAPPGPITRTFVPVEPPQEEPPVSKIAVATEPPTARQTETWELVQRLGSQTAAAKELGITQAGVQGNLRGYMAHMGIEGELPGKLSAEENLRMRAEAGKLGGRPPAAKPEPEAKIGVIRNGRTIAATATVDAEPTWPAPPLEPLVRQKSPAAAEQETNVFTYLEIRSADPEPATEQPSEDWELSNAQAQLILRAALPEVVREYRQIPNAAAGAIYTPMQAAERIARFLLSQGFELRIIAINPWT